ncbi:LysR substrate-binding domain-containing protein [Mesorhizobium sp. ZC-5]|uniref:LysR substrate-binding domain-containing protein n=1 Tax=Mesorhizobium sp. ZC-5 TaxID=2986066 RepID=UPI0021E85D92|nr:LysR substrate-binding domain-containing protein [Mesorhizobium sp. ZC-5]MCV3240663.1 LysR substrate-binding domain-containing protein [Mesorhizobium sp. ZC-5]
MSTNDGTIPSLDSDLLRTFLVVAQEGNVSRASSRLFRTQSAISLQVQKLEETVGHLLFQRHGRGVTLTPAGEKLLPIARRVVSTLDQTVNEMRGNQPGGEIRIGIPDEYGERVLASILASFSSTQANAQVVVRCGSSVEFPDMISRGQLDLAIHSPEIVSPVDVVIHREPAVWAASTFTDVLDRKPLPIALFDKACWWRSRCLELLEASGVNFQVVCTSESVAGVRSAIAAGTAVGVLPRISMTPHLRVDGDGFLPPLGDSELVLSKGTGTARELVDSMEIAIRSAFQKAA